MSGHGSEGSPPPEVPDEFAAAYRAAYERALAEGGGVPSANPAAEPADGADRASRDTGDTGTGARGGATADDDGREATDEVPELPPQQVTSVGSHRGPGHHRGRHGAEAPLLADEEAAAAYSTEYVVPSRMDQWKQQPWFVPVLLAALALVLILAAYVVGRVVAGDVKNTKPPKSTPSVVLGESGSPSTSSSPSPSKKPAGKHPWRGPVHPAPVQDAQATCTAPPGVDSGGHPVTYAAAHTIDSDPATAWRCDGTAVGERLVFRLPAGTAVGQVGLIPGYAKTDPRSHADRYAQNNRITRVRWILGSTSVEQTMSGDPHDRSLRLMRIPKTSADRLVLEILAVQRGPRDTTAISTVRVGAAG